MKLKNMKKEKYWHNVLVEISPNHYVKDRTLESKKDFKHFLKKHGYKLKKWEKAERFY